MVCLPTFPKLTRRNPETNSHQGNPTYKYAAAEKKKNALIILLIGKNREGSDQQKSPKQKETHEIQENPRYKRGPTKQTHHLIPQKKSQKKKKVSFFFQWTWDCWVASCRRWNGREESKRAGRDWGGGSWGGGILLHSHGRGWRWRRRPSTPCKLECK